MIHINRLWQFLDDSIYDFIHANEQYSQKTFSDWWESRKVEGHWVIGRKCIERGDTSADRGEAMSEWRPESWENPYFTQERYDECEGAYEDGADAMLAGLMKHLRDMAALHLDLAQRAIYHDSQGALGRANQLARDSTAFLIVADYIEYDKLRLLGEDPYPAIPDEE